MGGAYGHIMHLYEDLDLTFEDLHLIIDLARNGDLERATEKTDGMNLVFTFDVSTDELRVARSAGDVKKGGIAAGALAGRFIGRPGNVVAAFHDGFETLRLAMGALPSNVARDVFGDHGDAWYSAEVIDPSCSNVIRYDNKCIVLHAHGSFVLGSDGKPEKQAHAHGIDLLVSNHALMTQELGSRIVHNPHVFNGLAPAWAAGQAHRELDDLELRAGVRDTTSLRDYAARCLKQSGLLQGLNYALVDAVLHRAVGRPGSLTLQQVRKMAGDDKDQVNDFVHQEKALVNDAVLAVESIIYRFSVELLRGTRSAMVSDHETEIARIRQDVKRALSGAFPTVLLERHVQKLGDLSDIASTMEGIVFRFKGNVYKMTGAFAPVNQVLGAERYQR